MSGDLFILTKTRIPLGSQTDDTRGRDGPFQITVDSGVLMKDQPCYWKRGRLGVPEPTGSLGSRGRLTKNKETKKFF